MRVTIVGSGDAFGSGGRFQTCIAVHPVSAAGPASVLVDCGATSLVALRRQAIDPNDIRAVLLTHLHGDHFGGLPFVILDGQFRRRTHDLTVYGPAGTAERLDRAMEVLFPGSTAVERRFAVHVREHADRQTFEIEGLRATAFEVRHASGAPAYAIRVQDLVSGATLAYSGDTEWTESLLAAADGADLFLCEGYSPTPVRWHLDLRTLAEQRHRFRCRRMLLTHLSATALAADLTGWEITEDGLVLEL